VAQLITIYWRDIPAQVIGRSGRTRVKTELSSRFADAIDSAAMRAGCGGSDEYLADWRRDRRPCSRDLEQAVAEEVARLEAQFPESVLRAMVRANGLGPQPEPTQ
jgi:hypothetical protein